MSPVLSQRQLLGGERYSYIGPSIDKSHSCLRVHQDRFYEDDLQVKTLLND